MIVNHAKGHLFRIALNPTGLTITKDKDKQDPNSKIVQIGKIEGKIAPGQWHTMLVETQGDKVFPAYLRGKTGDDSNSHYGLGATK